ncbi:MAG: hypothetical protein M3O50_08275, partial [Myxococcota bacterium]|nr:hypothetical protein [Myxococcota bacterium]
PLGSAGPWPPAEPGSAVGGEGPAGTVHVATSPPGAEVWMVVGAGPDARIEQLSCERDIDVLIAGATARSRLHVTTGDFVLEDGAGSPGSTPEASRVARIRFQ